MDTSPRITAAMTELMRRHGYTATGLAGLARSAAAPTGSIYHHFPGGKRDVAAAALRESGELHRRLLPALLAPHDDVATGAEAAFAAAAQHTEESGWITMCPVATVGGEIADDEPELRAVAAEVIATWIDDGARLLESRGLGPDDARTLACAVVTAVEGAFLLARSLRSVEPFRAAGRSLAAYARTLEGSSCSAP